VDLALAAVGLGAGIAMADENSQDLRNVGATALGIYTFRKTADLLAAKKAASGGTSGGKMHGDFDAIKDSDMGEDPIVTAAKEL
jgi:hypothetical protein